MAADNEHPYVDPAIQPGDQGTEPWADGQPQDPKAEEDSPADAFTEGGSAGMDQGSADPDKGDLASGDGAD